MSFRDSTYPAAATRDEARTLFAHTMSLVAITAAFFAGGAYLGRDLSRGAGIIWFIAAFACLIGIRFAVARSEQLAVGLLFGFGVLIGLAVAPDDRLLREDRSAGRVAGGRLDRALHRRLRRRGLRHAARPLGARAHLLLRADRPDHLRDRR